MSQLIGVLIARWYRESNRLLASHWQAMGLGPGQHPFLLAISAQEGVSQEGLSALLATDKANTARIIGRLEVSGFVTRKPDLGDRRKLCCSLTSQGKALVPLIREALSAVDRKMSLAWSEAEKQAVAGLLEKGLDLIYRSV